MTYSDIGWREVMGLKDRLNALESRLETLETRFKDKDCHDCHYGSLEIEATLYSHESGHEPSHLRPCGALLAYGFKPGDRVRITRIKAGETHPRGAGSGI